MPNLARTRPCECSDPGCPVHTLIANCPNRFAMILYRSDMEDWSGVDFCEDCGEDALDSGVFAPKGGI